METRIFCAGRRRNLVLLQHCFALVKGLTLASLLAAQVTAQTANIPFTPHQHPAKLVSDQAHFDRVFTDNSALVGEVRIHYLIGGKGAPLLLLHGWPQTWYEWRSIMLPLARHFTVIAMDLRGGGDSDKPVAGYDKKTMAEDAYGLLQQLGFRQFNVVGHDIGGMVGYALAATHPEAVQRFAILDVPLPGIANWTEIKLNPQAWHFAFHGKRDIPEFLVSGRERGYLEAFFDEHAYKPEAITEDDLNYFTAKYSVPGALRGGFEWYRAFPQDEQDNQSLSQNKLPMPVLALGGEISAGSFIVQQMQTVALDVRGGSIPNAGHWLTEEQPQLLLQQLLTFFQPSRQAWNQ